MKENDIQKTPPVKVDGTECKSEEAEIKVCFPFWIGVDVSKDSFTAAAWNILGDKTGKLPPKESYSFEKKDVKDFLKWAREVEEGYVFGICMEATGIYSKRLCEVIHAISPEQHIAVCNPKSISFYARSFTEEKNDKNDAILIARYACDRQPAAPRQRDAAEVKLQELIRERNRYVEEVQALKNGLEALADKFASNARKRLIKSFETEIKNLENQIKKIVKDSEKIRHEVELMMTVPGVALISAASIYAELGSLKNYTRKQISAASGVCPVNKLSGTSVHKHKMSYQGSHLLRKILYLDCQQAIPRIPTMAEFHRKMLGKAESSKMSARCACMRKLLLILHALVVNETKFDPNYKSEIIFKNSQKMA